MKKKHNTLVWVSASTFQNIFLVLLIFLCTIVNSRKSCNRTGEIFVIKNSLDQKNKLIERNNYSSFLLQFGLTIFNIFKVKGNLINFWLRKVNFNDNFFLFYLMTIIVKISFLSLNSLSHISFHFFYFFYYWLGKNKNFPYTFILDLYLLLNLLILIID